MFSAEFDESGEPVDKRPRIEYADGIQGNQAYVVADEASVAAIQAMDEIRQHINEGTAVSGHITIPVAIATDAAIQVQDPGSLDHSVALAETIAQTTTAGGQEVDMTSPVHVVCAGSQTVVALVEGDGMFTQDGKHQGGFTMVSGIAQGGEVQVANVQQAVEENGGRGEQEVAGDSSQHSGAGEEGEPERDANGQMWETTRHQIFS